ncbi:MAG TPA: XrtA/PEP-CTERM system TPR-repeat protein PrsT [Casimicrobiaceae bacterium]|nr:XrtA/PEP-CTERM system TPR-repeat protein PrsT [Casimicrobiaceae bacterium]
MRQGHGFPRNVAIALICAALLSACGKDSPEKLIGSAKDYLAKHEHSAAIIELKSALQQSPNLPEARLLLGKALLESGDMSGAENELRRALELREPVTRVYPLLARSMLYQGEFRKVIEQFQHEDLGDANANAEMLTSVGLAQMSQRQPDAARATIAKALNLAPSNVEPLLAQARLVANGGDLNGALKAVDTALAASAKHLDALKFKADLLASIGQVDAAIATNRALLEIRPGLVAPQAAIASLLLTQGKLDEAQKQLEELVKTAPKHPDTLYLRAHYEYRRGNMTVAREAIQGHLSASPENVRGLLLASAIEHDLKAYAQAEAYLLRVLESSPNLGPARRLLISNYLRSGQHGKAIDALKPLLATPRIDAATLALAGETYLMSGRSSEAVAYFTKASELDPKDDRKLTGLALSHLAEGKTDEAYKELERAAQLGTSERADVTLIMTALQRKEYDRALTAIAALEKRHPGKPYAHNLRGSALLGKLDVEGARQSFERALSADPAFFPAAANLARLDLLENQPAAARKRFEGVLAKNPKSVESLLALAELKIRTGGTLDEAAALAQKAITANPTALSPRLALISLYISGKQPAKAVSSAQEAAVALPNRAEILEAMGRAYQANGSTNQALSAFSRWAAVEPKSPMPLIRSAEAYAADRQYDAAAEWLRKALELKPDHLDAQRRLVANEVRRGQIQSALAIARTVQKQRPKEAIGYALEGEIHGSQKALAPALAAYRNGLKQVDSADLAIRLHTALRSSNAQEAEQYAQERLKKNPNELAFRIYLAEISLATGDFVAAANHYKTLLASQPDNALWLNNLAYASGRNKDPKAIEYAERATKLAPGSAAILDTLAVLLVDAGETARGIDLLRKAAAMDPNAPAIRLNLARSLVRAGQKDAAKKELDDLARLGDRFAGQAEVDKLLKQL